MVLCYSGRSKPSALKIAAENPDIEAVRSGTGDVNWGRRVANTELNPDITNVVNKRLMRKLFKEHDVPMPRLISDETAIAQTIDGNTVVGRPDYHSKGRGLWICKTARGVQKAMEGTRKKKAATHFMEYIDAPREYRVHIFQGKSIRISEKTFYADPSTGAVDKTTYYTSKPKHEVGHVRRAAKKAVETVGLDFGAVDILANDNECWVLEVNAAPGLGGTMPALYARVFTQWERGDWDA